jgi:VIT1/CCC1 family predicted Fe2+/Mn2+ transporter
VDGEGKDMQITPRLRRKIIDNQRAEITEYTVYKRLSVCVKNKKDRELLTQLCKKELLHYGYWKNFSGVDIGPNNFMVNVYYFFARFLGLNFALQLMEGEGKHDKSFDKALKENSWDEIIKIVEEEKRDEKQVLANIDKSELLYTSSIVLGLNDALVELTGALVGFSFALQKPNLVAAAGAITGIAASFSMSTSEYLSSKEEQGKNPLRAGASTGLSYLLTVILMITPFFVFSNIYVSLAVVIGIALIIIFMFNFYISVAKNLPFLTRSGEMILISIGAAILNFAIGYIAKTVFKISV